MKKPARRPSKKRLSRKMGPVRTTDAMPNAPIKKHHQTEKTLNESKGKRKAIFHAGIKSSPLVMGGRAHITGVFTDSTSRQENKRSLRLMKCVMERTSDAVLFVDGNGRIRYGNPAACRHLGYDKEELLRLSIWDIDPAFPPDKRKKLLWANLKAGDTTHFETTHRVKDGRLVPVEVTINHITFENKGLNISFCRDISARKQAEETRHRLSRELRALSNCNQTLLRAKDEQTLLNDVCRIICDEAGYRLAWIGYAEHDKAKTVRLAAWAGFEDGYVTNAHLSWADTKQGRGPTGTTIRSGEMVFTKDFATDPKMAPWRNQALQHGYRSSIALPLKDKNANTFGALTVYSTEPNSFTTDEIRLLEELADDLAFGIMVQRARIKHQHSKEELAFSEKKFSLAFNVSPDAMAITDLETADIVDVNEAFVAWSGYTRQELLGRHSNTLHLWVSPEERSQVVAKLKSSSGTVRITTLAKVKDGSLRHIVFSANLIQIEGRTYLLSLTHDITERIRDEEARALNSQRLQALLKLNQMTQATLQEITDFTLEEAVRLTQSKIGYLAFLNEDESVLTMHSWSKSAMAECATSETPLRYPVATTGLWGEAVRQRQPVITNDYTTANPLKKGYPQGHVVIKRHMNIPVVEDSRIVIVAGVGNKTEEYNQGDVQQLTLLMEGMWRLLERKRAEEEHTRLLEAEKAARVEAEVANKAKDDFLAIVSHELRTPLTAIMGWIWLLRSGQLAEEERQNALDTIMRNMQSQRQIVEDLIDVSSLSRGQLNLSHDPVELNAILGSACDSLGQLVQGRDIRLSRKLSEPVGVLGDARRLQQVFTNLLHNAMKFTPKGGEIRVSLNQEGGQAVAVVQDSGKGIAADFLPHVFEAFRQGEDPLIREHQGLGLGLAIVKRLVELHDGTVSAVSAGKGRGAIFTVRLPAVTWPPLGQAARATRSAPDRSILEGINILVVEDEADARQLLQQLLSRFGALVTNVADAAEAWASLERSVPDLLLCDIALPGEDGCALIRKVRSRGGKLGALPAAALTAMAQETDRARALKAGFQVYLTKPIEPPQLLETVRALVGRR